MKHGYRILIVLAALLLAAAGVGISMLPDIVPVHYNFAGEVDRMGSKFEYLLLPTIAAVAVAIFALVARHCEKRGEKESALAGKILLGTAIFETVWFGGLELYLIWQAARYAPGEAGPAVTVDFLRVMGMGVGLLLILLGNVMPKARRNALFGLRTRWSMADDEVWRRSQRFGGFSAVGLGFALIMFGIFLDSLPYFMLCLAAGPVWGGLCIAMSYRFYKFYKEAG